MKFSHHPAVRVLGEPENVVAQLMMALLSFVPFIVGMPLTGVLISLVLGQALIWAAISNGGPGLLALALLYGALVMGASYSAADSGSYGLMVLGAVWLLIVADLVRTGWASRRGAVVSPQLLGSVLLGSLAAGVSSLVSYGLFVAVYSSASGGSWLWTPVAVGALLLGLLLFALLSGRGATDLDKRRWVPGEYTPPAPKDH